jgi:hypothetical protein
MLSPSSTEAMICTYECTFCKTCVVEVLENVCPNCGGGFCQRPNRPILNLKGGNYLGNNPASTTIIHKPVNVAAHNAFADDNKLPRRKQRGIDLNSPASHREVIDVFQGTGN